VNLQRRSKQGGFSVLELMVVVTIALIVIGFGVPQVISTIHAYRLRGSASNISSLAQTVRWRAVQADQFYSARLTTSGALEAYVDLAKTGSVAAGDPQTVIDPEVAVVSASSAPSTASLKSQMLPTGSTATLNDASVATKPITFGPRGLPCVPTTTYAGAGTASVCDSAGGTQAYWMFFQDNVTQKWAAVTVTPAGRIQVWYYANGWALNQM
jgi:Tfp pilus assembly protein FimT